MGGNIAANFLLTHDQSDFSCAILESPWFGLYSEVNPFLAFIASVLGRLSPKIAAVSKLSNSDVTGDNAKAEEMKNDPLYHNRISLRMLSGIKKACRYAVSNSARLSVPVYLAVAGHERIVCNKAVKKFHESCGPNVIIKEYDSNHAIHNDINRNDFYNDIISFLVTHT
jgi:alpha-beta hydrolase superfamily lysophospholipase